MGASVVDGAVGAATALDSSVVDDNAAVDYDLNHRRDALRSVCHPEPGHGLRL